MANEPVNTSIQNKYAEQLASDLASNQAEQATLTVRLSQLQEEEKWLTKTLESLPTAVEGETAADVESVGSTAPVAAGTEAAAVPQPRAEKTGGTASVRKSPAKKATAAKRATAKAPASKKAPAAKKASAAKGVPAAKEAPAEKAPAAEKAAVEETQGAKKAASGKAPAAKKTAVKKATAASAKKTVKSVGPTLGELLKELLAQQPGEPKKVSEIGSELKAAHPERTTSDQVVRNTLERLVVKDGLEKDTRQGVVLYTWPTPEAHAPAAAQVRDGEPAEAATAGV
ncbi:hypothetical protein [Streptomyces sp. CB02261]|uniref:hypothetical protein n=1 Tax=Streptomyces sp. CB02261 TaxID=1703940 RepID=UPI00093CF467|nr:hypothetical protein [Streptomyces sp. CB02261]